VAETTKKSKVKGKKVVDSCCALPCGDYKPRLYLDLEGKDVSQVKGLTVGEEVWCLIKGKVVGLEQRERSDSDGEMKKTGSIQLEGYEVDVLAEEPNDFVKMADEMTEGDQS